MEKILIIDGHHFLFKAYAVPFKFFSANGTTLHVVTTFLSLVRKAYQLCSNVKSIIVVFDSQGQNTNSQLSENYKANRVKNYSKMEDSPFKHLPFIKTVLNFLSIPWIEKCGYEADDVIASLAIKYLKKKSNQVVIASSDSDFYQLFTHKDVLMLRIVSKNKYMFLNKEWFIKEFGFMAKKYVLYKSYVGDRTDNIKGIKGIGKKRAKEIILGLRVYQLSSDEKKIIDMNLKLITLDTSLNIKITTNNNFIQKLALPNKNIFNNANFNNSNPTEEAQIRTSTYAQTPLKPKVNKLKEYHPST